MSVVDIMKQLDILVLQHWGDLDASLQTEEGSRLFEQLLSVEQRGELDDFYRPGRQLNNLASDLKKRLEVAFRDGFSPLRGTQDATH
jgi:hypothetical protein